MSISMVTTKGNLLDRSRIILSESTKVHINQLYTNPYIHDLINDPEYRKLYITVVFRHFRADFAQNGIGGWDSSHWPMVLQALDLLPGFYRIVGNQDKYELRCLWHTCHQNIPPEPIPNYGRTMVRVPPLMASVFQDDPNSRTQTVSYKYLVNEMQRFVASLHCSVHVKNFRWNDGKRLTFKAIYWLTVVDQFIGEVQRMERKDGGASPRCPFPRTEQVFIRNPNQVPQQADSRVGPMAQHGPSGSNPARRVPSAAAGATQVANPTGGGGGGGGGGQSSSGGVVGINPNHAARPLATLDPGHVIGYQILDSMEEPIYRRYIHHWPDQVDGFVLEQGGAGPLVYPIDRPGTSGGGVRSNPAAGPNREAKRKSTDQGGGPSKGDKKGPGGSIG